MEFEKEEDVKKKLVLFVADDGSRFKSKQEAKQKEQAKADYKSAHDWFLDCLKCDPGNKAAIEGEKQTRFMY